MIQATGTINLNNGLQSTNPIINIYLISSDKFKPTLGIAQIGSVESDSFNAVVEIGKYEYIGDNPSFEDVQSSVLLGLSNDYPEVTFEVIN